MGVILEKETYGVPAGLCFSFPCNVVNGECKIVEGLTINEFSRAKIDENIKELLEEKEIALGHLK